MDPDLKKNISDTKTWGRALFMLLFAIIYSVAEIVLLTVTFLQFCFVLVTRRTNPKLLKFGKELSTFVYQVFKYLTFNSDVKPFPFDEWPVMTEEELQQTLEQREPKDDV